MLNGDVELLDLVAGEDREPGHLCIHLGIVAEGGHRRAWLAVASGNTRARRFYERAGWVDEGAFDYAAEGPDGSIPVPCHRYSTPARD
jgi:hypothetical protein